MSGQPLFESGDPVVDTDGIGLEVVTPVQDAAGRIVCVEFSTGHYRLRSPFHLRKIDRPHGWWRVFPDGIAPITHPDPRPDDLQGQIGWLRITPDGKPHIEWTDQ